MKKMMEQRQAHLNSAMVKAALAPLRKAYQLEVERIAQGLALRFQAREFDGTKPEKDWPIEPGNDFETYPFNLLEDLCEKLPICRNPRSAKIVLASSRYANRAAFNLIESCMTHPLPGMSWWQLAAFCLSRDVHDCAIRHGWARSRRERSDTPYATPEARDGRLLS